MSASVLYEDVKKYVEEKEWTFTEDEEYLILYMNLKTVDTCRLLVQNDDDGIIIYTVFPIKVPEEKRVMISDFLTRANYNLRNGNFEMDFYDGEVRFKVPLLLGMESTVDSDHIRRFTNLGFSMLDRYGAGLLKLIYGGSFDPKQEIQIIEGDDDDDEDDDDSGDGASSEE